MEDRSRRNSPCHSSQESDPPTPTGSSSAGSASSSSSSRSLSNSNGSRSSNLRNNCSVIKNESEEPTTSTASTSSPQKSKSKSTSSTQQRRVSTPSAAGPSNNSNEDSPSKSSFSLTKNMESKLNQGDSGGASDSGVHSGTSSTSSSVPGNGSGSIVSGTNGKSKDVSSKCNDLHEQEDLPHNRIRRGNVCEAWQSTKSCLKERISYLFNNDTLSDVSFLVGRGRVRIPGHKFVLAIGSPVFDAMFNGPLQESNRTVELPDVEPEAFLALLKFLYSDEVSVSAESVLTVLYTAKKYAVPTLEEHCVAFLKDNLTAENAFLLLSQARLFDEPQLAALCLDCIDKNTGAAISADGFLEVDLATLSAVLERDTLRIREYNLFHAVLRWAASECSRRGMEVTPQNQRYALGRTLNLIRFPLMPVEEFAIGVAQLGLLSETELVRLFLNFNISSTNVEHRPKMEFIDRPRCYMTGKQLSVYRFQQVETRWGYNGLSDQIRFTTDRRIYVVGFGLYGGLYGTKEYRVDIQISNTLTNTVLGNTSDSFVSDGSKSTFKIMFKEPIEILPDLLYTASATLRGPDSHYGAKGQRKVGVECPDGTTVNFSFSYSSDNNNGTSVEDGQIPELIFHT